MKKILMIDVESIIYDTKKLNINILNEISKKYNKKYNFEETWYKRNFLSFKKLFNKSFNMNIISLYFFYLKHLNLINSLSYKHYHKTLKKNDILFLLQELKDIENSESYKIIYSYWDERTKKFMNSHAFKDNYHFDISKKNLFKWTFLNNSFDPEFTIKEFAKKNIAIQNITLMSNDIRILRYMNSIGMKTITLNLPPEKEETYIANRNIADLLTTNLIEILNDLN